MEPEPNLQASDFVEVPDSDYESKMALADRYGSSSPDLVSTPQEAQLMQEKTTAETALGEMQNFELPAETAAHNDFLTAMPEAPGSVEDRQRTRMRLEALNKPRELGGLAPYATADAAPPGSELGGSVVPDYTDQELDAYAQAGVDPVAGLAQEIIAREKSAAQQAISVAQREQAIQRDLAQREAVHREAYDRQARQAIDAARARGAHESWIQFQLSMKALPGHPDTR